MNAHERIHPLREPRRTQRWIVKLHLRLSDVRRVVAHLGSKRTTRAGPFGGS
jgi:hypothetical protein